MSVADHVCTLANHPPINEPTQGWGATPTVGDTVLYRPVCEATPISATVAAVQDTASAQGDPNVWGWVGTQPNTSFRLMPAANPTVTVNVGGDLVACRQIRNVNGPGWAWPDQET